MTDCVGATTGAWSCRHQASGAWRPTLDRPALVALLLGLAGVGYRLVLTLFTVPVSNSDEATFGLAALHIAGGHERPVFLYGQRYMGMLESYLAAPLVGWAGPSWPLLRLPLLALYVIFLWLAYRLTRRLFSPWLAVFVVGLLALGSERVVRDQLTVVGGRPEVKPAVLAMLLIAVALGERRIRHRWLATGLFGLLAGLALWSDWLIAPYLLVAGLAAGAGRPAGPARLAGSAAGRRVPGRGRPGGEGQHRRPARPGLAVGVPGDQHEAGRAPALAGAAARRAAGGGAAGARALPDRRLRGWAQWFGALYPVLLVAAAALGVVAYRRAVDPAARVRAVALLALVAGAALTLLAYVRSPLAADRPAGQRPLPVGAADLAAGGALAALAGRRAALRAGTVAAAGSVARRRARCWPGSPPPRWPARWRSSPAPRGTGRGTARPPARRRGAAGRPARGVRGLLDLQPADLQHRRGGGLRGAGRQPDAGAEPLPAVLAAGGARRSGPGTWWRSGRRRNARCAGCSATRADAAVVAEVGGSRVYHPDAPCGRGAEPGPYAVPVLILLPPSEGKAEAGTGRRLDLSRLSLTELNPAREAVLNALVDLCAGPDEAAARTRWA